MNNKINDNAKTISDIFLNTDAADRGLLLYRTSKELSKNMQHYTASLLENIAKEYGFNKGELNE